jgi:phospholipid/cholesterol/gamma-HCH transport system substrate-binding protein
MRMAIRKHRSDFVAVIVLFAISIGVGGYILGHQRFYLPKWFPVLGSDFVTLKAQMTTAQSVTPGQGQTVNIAGVPVGEITKVDLVGGRAVVTIKIKRKYAKVHRDATMLLRPKTGLNDMVLELTPGHTGPLLKQGDTIPVQQTLPNVNTDEILASLDADTRDYLRLLVNAGGEGLRGQGPALSATLRRFEPTGRDLARFTGLLSQRHANLKRVVHSFSALSVALSQKDDQLAQLVDSSNAVFRSFANQQSNLRETIRLLPNALQATQTALSHTDTLARALGPALQDLRPGARALGPTLRQVRPFVRQTVAPIRDQIRPFTRAALPTVQQLRPAAANLAATTPDLTSTFRVLNVLANTLAYNPPGAANEGFLFFAAWSGHNANLIFNTQDAHGPIRRGPVSVSCPTLSVLKTIADPAINPALATLTQLLGAPIDSPACPAAAAPAAGATTTAAPANAAKAGR